MAGTTSSCSVDEDPASWLCSNARKGMAGNQVKGSEILLYVWWNVWKGKKKRIFNAVERTEL
jgi:hypothetical protein